MSYPAIEDHGLAGDLQTAALVSTDGTVDWMCLPRFHSPDVFASLLGRRSGGRFALTPAGSKHVTRQMYLPDTAILVTRFLSPGGVAEVVDSTVSSSATSRSLHAPIAHQRRTEPRPAAGPAESPQRRLTWPAGARLPRCRPTPVPFRFCRQQSRNQQRNIWQLPGVKEHECHSQLHQLPIRS